MANQLKVVHVEGNQKGEESVCDFYTSLLVGRSRSSDIRLTDPDVSGRHFEFVRLSTGCCVRGVSHHGLTVDGKLVGEGETAPIHIGTVVEIGASARLRVEDLPTAEGSIAETALQEQTGAGTDFFETDAATGLFSSDGGPKTLSPDEEATADDAAASDNATRSEFSDAKTEAGEDGETQEMKTRVGSIEEILARKRQLDRASVARRWRIGIHIFLLFAIVGGAWYALGTRRHISDAEGPFREDGSLDAEALPVHNDQGKIDLLLVYPRDAGMKVDISADTNTVNISTVLGIDRDVPFRLEFRRKSDRADLQNSLEDSFERLMLAETSQGVSYETHGGQRPEGVFFENVYADFCSLPSMRGIRFVQSEYTRSRKHELWHGVCIYFRCGDTHYQFRKEVPEAYWKRASYRLYADAFMQVYSSFSKRHWDSPGRSGLVSGKLSDDELLGLVKRELSAERVSAWPTLLKYIDTLLVRSWGAKPVVQKTADAHYRTLLERMDRFYHERELAFRTAAINRDSKRMKAIFGDCKSVFGAMTNDRRSSLVNDPGVWSCQ